MKKICSLILALTLIFSLAVPSFAAFDSGAVTGTLGSKIYYMQSLDEDTVFFEKNSEKKTAAAAFVKIVAAVTAIEKWSNLDEYVTVTDKSLSLVEYGYGIRTASYKAGEKVTKRELIDCLIVYSANDAASIIAYEVSGSLEAFIDEMKKTVEKMGCTSTVIKNIHGFDEDGQYTTAKDVAKIIKYAMNFPVFVEAFSATSVTLKATEQNSERTVNGSNKMMNSAISDYYHSSVTGGKQTYTEKAGECIAVVSTQDGYSYITVVMDGELKDIDSDGVDENSCMTDAKKMLAWVYKNIRYRVVVSANQTITSVPVSAAKGTDKIRLIPEKETSSLVPSNATTDSVLVEIVEGSISEKIKAPIKAGDVLGQARVYYAGVVLATINLVAAEDVNLSFMGLVMTTVRNIMTSTAFIVLLIIAIVCCLAYVLYTFNSYRKKEKQRKALQRRIERRKRQMNSATQNKNHNQKQMQKK